MGMIGIEQAHRHLVLTMGASLLPISTLVFTLNIHSTYLLTYE